MARSGMFNFGRINPKHNAQIQSHILAIQQKLKDKTMPSEERYRLEQQIKSLQRR